MSNLHPVEAFLGFSTDDRSMRIYEAGIDYLDRYAKIAGEETARLLEGSRNFWNWWTRCWDVRNQRLTAPIDQGLSRATVAAAYEKIHRVHLNNLKPHSSLIAACRRSAGRKRLARFNERMKEVIQ